MQLQLARQYMDTAILVAQEMRLAVAVAVVDRGGRMVCGARMDEVGYINLEIARRKANAAQNFAAPLHSVMEAIASDVPIQRALATAGDELVVLPGGFPILKVATVVGGLGIAGGHYSQDRTIGERVVERLAAMAEVA